ncbi:MAG: tetratricopeptide repeat protein [Myxococcales bacterium]|nr:tetratricopeptide repeat protein [Myxococcales bacterium]
MDADAASHGEEGLAYVGTTVCASCHAEAFAAWSGSDHDRAMQEPSDQTVLGAFDGSTVSHGDETFVLVTRDGGFVAEVRGVDGLTRRYPVRYTFGVEPLQQYLVDLGDGRLQALPVAWDARPAHDGGQRWFHLQADEPPVPPGDPLHWRAPAFTWNDSCADCHSTGVAKGYERASRSYATTFAEIDVGCEACHGRGSEHVAAARAGRATPMPFSLVKPDARAWMPQPDGPIARLQGADAHDPELDRCAPCHSHRSALASARGGMHDRVRIALLDEGLYLANGQIDGEVFVLGSFLQSKMHAAGVVCSDCHEPHGLELRASGNALCATCHRPEVFDTTEHHLHPPDSAGAQCTACHMPQRRYMGVDERADHRLGVPDPMLAARVGAPDPCLGCHPTQTPQQAAEAIGERPVRTPASFGDALLAARTGEPGAAERLLELLADGRQPGIVRATALQELGRRPTPALPDAIEGASRDDEPLVRRTAAQLGGLLPPGRRDRVLDRLLDDPTRSVRVEAVATVVGAGPEPRPAVGPERLAAGLEEYRRVQEASADRAHGLTNLALLARFEGRLDRARALLEEALELEPSYLAAHVNLADLHRAEGREAEAEAVLRRALSQVEDRAVIQHALGLALIREGSLPEALESLEAAALARPDVARYAYVHAVARFDHGEHERALGLLRAAHERHPSDREILAALVSYCDREGLVDEARRHRDALRQLRAGERAR